MSTSIEVHKRDLLSLNNSLSEEMTLSLADEDTDVAYTLVATAKSWGNWVFLLYQKFSTEKSSSKKDFRARQVWSNERFVYLEISSCFWVSSDMESTLANKSKDRFLPPTIGEEEPWAYVFRPDCLAVLMLLSSLSDELMDIASVRSANRSIWSIFFRHKVLVNSIAFSGWSVRCVPSGMKSNSRNRGFKKHPTNNVGWSHKWLSIR